MDSNLLLLIIKEKLNAFLKEMFDSRNVGKPVEICLRSQELANNNNNQRCKKSGLSSKQISMRTARIT